jgi:hypothetical protein
MMRNLLKNFFGSRNDKEADSSAVRTQNIMKDFVTSMDGDEYYTGNTRVMIEPPVAPRKGVDLAKIEEEPPEEAGRRYRESSIPDEAPKTVKAPTPAPVRSSGKSDSGGNGWGNLSFGD